jgi:hypothetical protein
MALFNYIENMISNLETKIPWDRTGPFYPGKLERSDWPPVWDLCKRIQEAFKSGDGFSSREEQNAAWARFAAARKKASDLAEKEKEAFAYQSKEIRNDILRDIKYCTYSPLSDAIFFFDPTTVEDIKRMGQTLKDAGQKLSDSKKWMLGEHKNECFQAILEHRASLDNFWSQRKQHGEERRAATARKQREFEDRRDAWRSRVSQNIRNNRDKLESAQGALSRTRDRIREVSYKLSETTSDKWRDIFVGWLAEAQAKEQDIEESIERIRGWIAEDEAKLNS